MMNLSHFTEIYSSLGLFRNKAMLLYEWQQVATNVNFTFCHLVKALIVPSVTLGCWQR